MLVFSHIFLSTTSLVNKDVYIKVGGASSIVFLSKHGDSSGDGLQQQQPGGLHKSRSIKLV